MIKKTASDIIKNFDFFSQPVTFRFNDQSAYQSITGGIVSIGVIILFAVLFTTTILETFQKSNVDGKTTKIQQEDPSYSVVKAETFMFGVGITGINLNVGPKWFDVYFEKSQYQGKIKTSKEIKLIQCQKQQWTNIQPSLASTYDRIGFQNWLCPPPQLQMQLQGKYLSEVFSFYKITVRQCNSSNATAERQCVANDTIQSYLNQQEFFKFNFYFTNTILNPGNQDYIEKYLDDSNFYPFTTNTGLSANFYISQYNISTDQSISPLSDINKKEGFISDVPTQTQYYELRSQNYIKFYIRKSSLHQNIERSFRKADDTLSYIGGLFSAILFLLFIIGKYNQYSYELEVAKNLFHYEKNRPLNSRSFNFLVFLGYVIYLFFQKICIQLPWKTMQKFHRSLEEVRKQMDIRLLMKKVMYAERMAIAIFDHPKAKILHLQQPLTLEEAEQIRKDHRLYQKIQQRYFDYRKIREQDQLKELQNKKNELSEIINEQKNEQTYSSLKRISKNEEAIQINSIILRNQQSKIIIPKTKPRVKKSIKIKSIPNITDRQKKQTISEQEIKQLEFNEMIEKMKEYVQILEIQSKSGDMISQKILNRFDHKIMDILAKNKKDKKDKMENIQVYDLNNLINGSSNEKLSKL